MAHRNPRIWNETFLRSFAKDLLDKKSYIEIGKKMNMSPKAMVCGYSKFRPQIEALKNVLIIEEKAKENEIKLDREYVTKGAGFETRIYATDGIGNYCVHGAFHAANGWISTHWDKYGINNNDDEFNLVLKTPKICRTLYMWANKMNDAAVFGSLEKAQSWLESKGTGCIVMVNIDAEEGTVQ